MLKVVQWSYSLKFKYYIISRNESLHTFEISFEGKIFFFMLVIHLDGHKPLLCPIGMQCVAHRSRVQSVQNGYLGGTLWYAFHKIAWTLAKWTTLAQYTVEQHGAVRFDFKKPFNTAIEWGKTDTGLFSTFLSSLSKNLLSIGPFTLSC